MVFFNRKTKQIQQDAQSPDLFNDFIISDYTILKSLLFARTNLPPDEYKLFFKIYQALTHTLNKPDLILYLHRETTHVQSNINKRGRLFENNISNEYLSKIQDSYFEFFKSQTIIPVVVINLEDQDFTKNKTIYKELEEIVFTQFAPGLHHIKILN
ncbi:MAG: deoxynucleoside kinase [Saprospiraceae bacterium]|nr:deoxynucleoside kinase [Saprospiraceae bacterium]